MAYTLVVEEITYRCFCLTSLSLLLWGGVAIGSGLAQVPIVADTTLPMNSLVTPNGNTMTIDGGTIVGNNLFHSFREFSVPGGTTALFSNPTNLDNILTRVTGGLPSQIDGLIQIQGTANLFLLNPNGITFGPNAALNLGGSFIASTANSLQFSDGSSFSATQPTAPSLLAINVPIGLQFGPNPGNISNQSQAQRPIVLPFPENLVPKTSGLEVPFGKTLALIGGNVQMPGGHATALDGQVHLGAVASPGLVRLTPTAAGLSFDYGAIATLGSITFTGAASVNTSGLGGGPIDLQGAIITLQEKSHLTSNTLGDFNGSGIRIRGDQLRLSDRAYLSTITFGNGNSGGITIQTSQSFELTGTNPALLVQQLLTETFDPFNLSDGLYSLSIGKGTAGDLRLDTPQISLNQGANLLTTSILEGKGGELQINASERAVFANGSFVFTGTVGTGKAGNLDIVTPNLQVLSGSSLTTSPGPVSTGQGGNLTVKATVAEFVGTPANAPIPNGLFTTTLGLGRAGDLKLNAETLRVTGGAQVSASSAGAGAGGNLQVHAQVIELSGISDDGQFLSGLFTSSSLLTVQGIRGTAPAGRLTVNADRLLVRDGAQISSATGSQGAAGDLNITATTSVEVRGFATGVDAGVESVSFGVIGDGIVPSAIESNTSGTGNAGNLIIRTRQLTVRDGAEVGVRGTGEGAAGDLSVFADDRIQLDNNGVISAATIAGQGGNLQLQTPLLVLRNNSRILTNTGNQDGGNITIASQFLVAQTNSDITANAQQGRGGRVAITAQGIFGTAFREQLTLQSDITATSELGPGFSGTVIISTPEIDPDSGLVNLPQEPIDSSRQIIVSCAAAQGNSFTVTGRGGLPEDPTALLRGQTIWQDWQNWSTPTSTVQSTSQNISQPELISQPNRETSLVNPAIGWQIDDQGQVTLLAVSSPGDGGRSFPKPPTCQQLNAAQEIRAIPASQTRVRVTTQP